MGRKRKKILLENIHISDAGAKGKAITRLENGLVLFVEGVVPWHPKNMSPIIFICLNNLVI